MKLTTCTKESKVLWSAETKIEFVGCNNQRYKKHCTNMVVVRTNSKVVFLPVCTGAFHKVYEIMTQQDNGSNHTPKLLVMWIKHGNITFITDLSHIFQVFHNIS